MPTIPGAADGTRPTIDRVLVVVPARNEQELIGACLDAVAAARDRLRLTDPRVSTDVLVVLDGCTDDTELVVGDRGVRAVSTDLGLVGAVRATGIDIGLADPDLDPARTWIACTDADSVVPIDWLSGQVRAADLGVDLILGTVRPVGLSPAVDAAWRSAHDLRDGHRHVHGANLGVRASWYRACGGFAAVPVGEDRLLAREIAALGGSVVATAAHPVATSARAAGRAPDGFAQYVRDLVSAVEPTVRETVAQQLHPLTNGRDRRPLLRRLRTGRR